jgi:alkylation response protein AidB-like acyl-CoA dehydrogenase
MNLELDDEQVALRDTVRRFLRQRAPIATHVRELMDEPSGTTDAVWRGLAELGTTGLLVPDEHGGSGMTMVEAGVVLEELGRALHPGPWLSAAVAAPRALHRCAAADDAGDLLAGIATGRTIATVAVIAPSEPLRLDPVPDGAVLSGDLHGVADAAAAHCLLVIADGDLLTVPLTGAGAALTPRAAIDPTRKHFTVTLDHVPARRLATATDAAVRALVDDLIIARAADALGAAQALVDLTVDYAKARRQFGQPIGSFQAVQHLCVDMYERVELARGGVLRGLWAADHATADEHHLAAVRCKAFSGELAAVGDAAIQVHGGIGFTWDHDAHLYLRRLLDWSAFRGGPDHYLRELGTRLAHTVRS